MGLDYPQSTDDSHAILAALKGQHIERLEQDVQRQLATIKALREQLTKTEARAEQAEQALKEAGLLDVAQLRSELDLKNQHIRRQAVINASLRNSLNMLRAGKQKWHDEPTETEADLP